MIHNNIFIFERLMSYILQTLLVHLQQVH